MIHVNMHTYQIWNNFLIYNNKNCRCNIAIAWYFIVMHITISGVRIS